VTEQSKELATFVFEGTVKRIRAANLKKITDTKRTAVVKVGTIRRAGREVTIRLAEGERVKAVQEAIFHTNSWIQTLYAATLADQEILLLSVPARRWNAKSKKQKAKSNRLLDHLVGARYEVGWDPVTDGWRGRKSALSWGLTTQSSSEFVGR
jgi:phosphoribosylanthranilate isomerase